MVKKTIEIELVQCDHVDESGKRCSNENDKGRMRSCNVCGIDVCDDHSGMSYVTSRVISNSMLRAGQHRFGYCFCVEHMDDLINFVVDKLGNKYEIPPTHFGGGVGETQLLETKNQFESSKINSSKQ